MSAVNESTSTIPPETALDMVWKPQSCSLAAVVYATRHVVVSQVVRPEVASFLPPFEIHSREFVDARRCVTALKCMSQRRLFPGLLTAPNKLPLLSELDLSRSNGNERFFKALAEMTPLSTQLRSLDVGGCDLDRESLKQIARLPNLTHLCVNGCNDLADVATHFPKMKQLESLTAKWCHGIKAETIASMTGLKGLDITGTTLAAVDDRDADLLPLSRLPELHTLACMFNDTTTQAALTDLSQLRHLRALDLACLRIHSDEDSEQLAQLSNLTDLTSLTFRQLDVETECLRLALTEFQANVRSLQTLSITQCSAVETSCMAEIAKIRSLTSLDVRQCQLVTIAGLTSLAGHPCMTELNVSGCTVAPRHFMKVLSAMPLLRRLVTDPFVFHPSLHPPDVASAVRRGVSART